VLRDASSWSDAASAASFESETLEWIERAALALEIFAVALIVILLIAASIQLALSYLRTRSMAGLYDEYRKKLGRSLLLGLEILVAADIVRTVALEPSLTNVAVLGILVLVRTFLSWSLSVEIEGRWPWSGAPAKDDKPPETD